MRLHPGEEWGGDPRITGGTKRGASMEDGGTFKTGERKPASHYENTIAILDDGIEILSL